MSDNSTGSSSSSSNSWTLLSPEEAAIDIAGPLDDGTESTGDVASLSEEVAGISFAVKPSDCETALETILSEEGHQVCQETSPEIFEEGVGAETDPEICAPIIHATITTSSSDSDLLEAVPFGIATDSSHFLSQEPFIETSYESLSDVQPVSDVLYKQSFLPGIEAIPVCVDKISPAISPASEPVAEIGSSSEPIANIGPFHEPIAEICPSSEPVGEIGPSSESVAKIGPSSEPVAEIGPSPESVDEIGPSAEPIAETDSYSEPTAKISSLLDLPKSSFPDVAADLSLASDCSRTSAIPLLDILPAMSSHHISLSSEMNVSFAPESHYTDTPDSSVLEEKHTYINVAREAELFGTDVVTEHQGSGLRQRHVHYPEELGRTSDEEDEEETEFRIPERKEEKPGLSMSHVIIGALALLCLSSFYLFDDFDGSELSDQELLEKLVEENKQISMLEAQIQTQKEELDRALKAAAEKGITDEQHSMMKEELSALPSLKEELEALKARVSELTQLTGGEPSELFPGFVKEGQSQAVPDRQLGKTDELKRQKILLEQSQTRLEEMKKHNWPKKWLPERLVEMQKRLLEHVDSVGKKNEWRKKHKEKENRKSGRGDSVQQHKDLMKKFHNQWEQRKTERKLERVKRKRESSWQARPDLKQKHDHTVTQHHESKDFWKIQEKKLRRNQNAPKHCHDVSGCAEAEGLVRVKLSEFQGILDSYLNKLKGLTVDNREAFHHLVAHFFHGGVFRHDKMLFSEFVEDMADILEDLADVLVDDNVLEEEMEEFEKEALWHFAEKGIKSQS